MSIRGRLESGGRVWAMGDIHGNGLALVAALESIPAGDGLVCMGDLLTYGADPVEVVDRVSEALSMHSGTLLLGNHDQLYLDLKAGDCTYYEKLPEWIQESVDWTMERLDMESFEALPWQRELVEGDFLFDHANPFEYGDWRYMNHREDHDDALAAMGDRGFRVGVFGHTHRVKSLLRDDFTESGISRVRASVEDTLIINTGSVGQPRDDARRSTMLELSMDRDTTLEAEVHEVHYDVTDHQRRICAAAFSATTEAKLLSFFDGVSGAQ